MYSTTACTPFYLNCGDNPKTVPADLLVSTKLPSVNQFLENISKSKTLAEMNVEAKNISMAKHANKKHLDLTFKIGDIVWLSIKKSTARKWKLNKDFTS